MIKRAPSWSARATLLAFALGTGGCRALLELLAEPPSSPGPAPLPTDPSAQLARRPRRHGPRPMGRIVGSQTEVNWAEPLRIAPGTVPPSPVVAPGAVQPTANLLRITFLDVGQGDAALLQTADGHAALIDAGPPEGTANLLAALRTRGINTLDWVLLSHPHLDHLGGLRGVFDQQVRVTAFYDPAYPHPTAAYNRVLASVQQLGALYNPARQGQWITLGAGVRVEILQPHEPFIAQSRSPVNASSVVARVHAGNVRVLFMGDAESETEERLVAENSAQLQADVLKVAHHGSRYASGAAILGLIHPRYGVISCAQGNDYGHPHLEALQRLGAAGVEVFRTDLNGDVLFATDGAAFTMTPARPAAPDALRTPGIERGGREPQ